MYKIILTSNILIKASTPVSYTIFDTSIVNLMAIQVNVSILSTAPKFKKVCNETFPVLESRDNLHDNIYGKRVVPNYIHHAANYYRDWAKLLIYKNH